MDSMIISEKPKSSEDFVRNGWNVFVKDMLPKAFNSSSEICEYRHIKNEVKYGCFVGVQLPDELYYESYDGLGKKILELMGENDRIRAHFECVDRDILRACQDWHDDIEEDENSKYRQSSRAFSLFKGLDNLGWVLNFDRDNFEFISLVKKVSNQDN